MDPQNVHWMHDECLLAFVAKGYLLEPVPGLLSVSQNKHANGFPTLGPLYMPGLSPQTWVSASKDYPPQACLTAIPNASVPETQRSHIWP